MNYGELTTQFSDILNRDDVTTSQIATCFQLAQTRIERILRQRSTETELVIDTSAAAVSVVAVPTDFIEVIAFNVDGYEELTFKEPGEYRAIDAIAFPIYFTRIKSQWLLNGPIPKDAVARILYYGKGASITATSGTEIPLSLNHPDLLLYGALTYSGDIFVDERQAKWAEAYSTLMSEVLDDQITSQMREGDSAVSHGYILDDGDY